MNLSLICTVDVLLSAIVVINHAKIVYEIYKVKSFVKFIFYSKKKGVETTPPPKPNETKQMQLVYAVTLEQAKARIPEFCKSHPAGLANISAVKRMV